MGGVYKERGRRGRSDEEEVRYWTSVVNKEKNRRGLEGIVLVTIGQDRKGDCKKITATQAIKHTRDVGRREPEREIGR